MLFQSNGARKYLWNDEIMSNFSRDTTLVAFCWPSFILRSQCPLHTPATLGTLPDIAANARPLRAWLKCHTITTHARESVTDLSRNCKGFRAWICTCSCDRITRAGDGRWPRYQVKSLACPICVFINLWCTTSGFIVYPGSLFVLWILMNQSFQLPHAEVGMVSLLYNLVLRTKFQVVS